MLGFSLGTMLLLVMSSLAGFTVARYAFSSSERDWTAVCYPKIQESPLNHWEYHAIFFIVLVRRMYGSARLLTAFLPWQLTYPLSTAGLFLREKAFMSIPAWLLQVLSPTFYMEVI